MAMLTGGVTATAGLGSVRGCGIAHGSGAEAESRHLDRLGPGSARGLRAAVCPVIMRKRANQKSQTPMGGCTAGAMREAVLPVECDDVMVMG